MKRTLLFILSLSAVGPTVIAAKLHAQAATTPHLKGYYRVIPWKGGTAHEAMAAAVKGGTVPLTSFRFKASKNNETYTDVIVGQSPFDPKPAPMNVKILVVPMVIQIGGTVFDSTAGNSCGGSLGHSDVANFQGSPILTPVTFDGLASAGHAALINGVAMGEDTYNDAHRRAEFLNAIGGPKSRYGTQYQVQFTAPQTIKAATSAGHSVILADNGGCSVLGGLEINFFDAYFSHTVLRAVRADPSSFVIFLMRDVVLYDKNPDNCCTLGYHATLKNLQTYSAIDYDTTGEFTGVANVTVAAHEIGEWLDDPLGTNPTPLWRGTGQIGGCQNKWEVGDPLSGTNFPAITMPNHVTYNPQENAFWSWFYSADHDTKFAGTAGGKYSMNGTFGGPSKVCPPGGTFPN